MRVQRAVAMGLLSLVAGCGRAAVQQGTVAMAQVMWGLHEPGDSPLTAAAVPEKLAIGDDADTGDRAEAFLAGSGSLWPEADHPKVVSHASRLRQEMRGSLRVGIERSGRYM